MAVQSTPFMRAQKTGWVRPWYGKILPLTAHPKTMRGGSTDMGQMPESTTNNKPS